MSLKRSIVLSVAMRPLGMIISLLYTPLLLSYLGQEEYGIWVTILSVINWINYFDIGIGNGYRNKLAEAITVGNDGAVAALTRTAYSLLTGIVALVFVFGCGFIVLFDVNSFFSTAIAIKAVLIVSLAFVCVNFVAALCKPQLFALQKAELVSLMAVLLAAQHDARRHCRRHRRAFDEHCILRDKLEGKEGTQAFRGRNRRGQRAQRVLSRYKVLPCADLSAHPLYH